jgi:membrane protease YdiL (CAAX protease family)
VRDNSNTISREIGADYQAGKATIRKKDFAVAFLYLLAIAAAELIIALVSPLGGIILHIFLLIGLVLHATIAARQIQHRLYLALALAPLIRLLSLSMPLTRFPQVYWYAIIAVPLLIAVFAVMRRLGLGRRDVGLTLNQLPFQLLVGLTGIPFGIVEFYILRPDPLVASLTWQATALPALVLLVGTGFAEELTFRGVMQTSAEKSLGKWGWLFIAVLFAVMHTGYLSLADISLVLVAGIFFGWAVKKSGSLLGVTLSHGIANIVLYLVFPFLI